MSAAPPAIALPGGDALDAIPTPWLIDSERTVAAIHSAVPLTRATMRPDGDIDAVTIAGLAFVVPADCRVAADEAAGVAEDLARGADEPAPRPLRIRLAHLAVLREAAGPEAARALLASAPRPIQVFARLDGRWGPPARPPRAGRPARHAKFGNVHAQEGDGALRVSRRSENPSERCDWSFDGSEFRVPGGMPDALLRASVGRPLTDVVDLPGLAGAGLVVRTARHHRNMGLLAITVANPLLATHDAVSVLDAMDAAQAGARPATPSPIATGGRT